MIRIYYPKDHYIKKHRGELFPLLKAFIKGTSFTDLDRIAMYGVTEKDYQFVDNIAQSDIAILTMSWNYYQRTKQLFLAEDFIKEAEKFHKKVFTHTTGDFGVTIPYFKYCIVLRPNGYVSKLPSNHVGIPIFIEDPLKNNKFETKPLFETNIDTPLIGFCGQTNASLLNALKEIGRVCARNLKFYLKLSINSPQKIMSSSYFRGQTLKIIKKSSLLNNNFIERKKYRAGVRTSEERAKTTQDFYENIYNAMYTVCVRGGGNFSVRLYETLAMGRIPIFVNTDCLMPLSHVTNWKNHLVWVEENELNTLPEKIVEFHRKYSFREKELRMKQNRLLWEKKLSFDGYFKTLFESNKE
ncbi:MULTISPECIES: hypothetical protein [Flavobacteriaceae]|uniref:Exostosin GT47 domain-containing protein n=2 Tax=Flavobacteriaceae TaxID=49546 RepID=A0A4Y8AVN2_9FLAO|nr:MULTISPECIES: hypothetical protein [Flavobacteriaceae]TEW76587.1 hypothetical protein E2488_01685 [Gramella jeungdoensis]GGK51741.1 hypothetical protein GCM10007963_20150 [Lutibacter litoralis]